MRLRSLSLVALSVTVGSQVFRVTFPLAYHRGEDAGFVAAGIFTAVVFLVAPLLAPLLRRAVGPRLCLPLAVVALVALRVVMQVVHPIPLSAAYAASAVALVTWTLELTALRGTGRVGGNQFAIGLIIGMSVDTALRSAFWTWDYAWQSGPSPLLLTLALSAGLLLALWPPGALPEVRGEADFGSVIPTALVGPFLMLQLLFLQSPAFVASSAGYSLAGATTVVLVGDAVAAGTALWTLGRQLPTLGRLAWVVALVAAAVLLTSLSGPAVPSVVVVGQALAAGSLALALAPSGADRHAATWRTSGAFAVGGLTFLLFAFLYQLHYEIPLPFPNTLLPPIAAALLSLGALGARAERSGARPEWRLVLVPLGLLVVPLGLLITRPDMQAVTGEGTSFRLVDYNLHSGVSPGGQLDPEAIARVIEAEHPDVVTLQEVARGWPISGTIDLAEWLSRRLRMPFVYGPAADEQFGNMLLSRLPILDWTFHALPKGAGPMERSYILAEIDLGDRGPANVFTVHLQHKEENTPTRLEEIDVLLAGWGGRARTIIAGDLNGEPGSPEISKFEDAGLISAVDVTGHGDLLTAPTVEPDARVDWIFGTSDVTFSDLTSPQSTASDHFPLAVTASLP